MKLLVAIVRKDYASDVRHALTSGGFRTTQISTTGGFLRMGNATFLVGVRSEQVDEALRIIDASAGPAADTAAAPPTHPPSRATIFVLNTDEVAQY